MDFTFAHWLYQVSMKLFNRCGDFDIWKIIIIAMHFVESVMKVDNSLLHHLLNPRIAKALEKAIKHTSCHHSHPPPRIAYKLVTAKGKKPIRRNI